LSTQAQAGSANDALDCVLKAVYTIEKRDIHLISGRAEVPVAPGSAINITTTVFGEPVYGDLNGDGRDDAALFLVYDPGGSGTFYYIATAITRDGIFQGTNAVFLGDRIAPRTINIRNKVIAVYYADRRPDEPMAAAPSIVKTMYLRLKKGRLEATEAP